jgi:uncharacterized protein YxjI
MATAIASLPAPVAVTPEYIAKQTEILTLTREPMSLDWVVTLNNGNTILILEGEPMSLSHRKTVKDGKGNTLYQVRRETFTFGNPKYYAETSEGGPRVWEMEMHTHMFSGSDMKMTFSNKAAGGKPDSMEFKNNPWGSTGYIKYQGREVASIGKISWQFKHVFELTVAKGLDMTLIVGIMVCMDDMIRSKNNASAASAAGSTASAC